MSRPFARCACALPTLPPPENFIHVYAEALRDLCAQGALGAAPLLCNTTPWIWHVECARRAQRSGSCHCMRCLQWRVVENSTGTRPDVMQSAVKQKATHRAEACARARKAVQHPSRGTADCQCHKCGCAMGLMVPRWRGGLRLWAQNKALTLWGTLRRRSMALIRWRAEWSSCLQLHRETK